MRMNIARSLAVGALVLGASACGGVDADRDEAGEIVESADVDAFNIRAGDCFNMPDGLLIETVDAMPCTDEHDSQAFELFEISGFEALPTADEMQQIVIDGCLGSAFENFIGTPYAESILSLTWFEPTQDTWDGLDDREVVCIATNEAELLTQDLEGSGI